jgi:hypothetical protein
MRRDEVASSLSNSAFEFFFWFSRFEFALKVNRYLKSNTVGAIAEPGWEEFVRRWNAEYVLSLEASHILNIPPNRQIVGHGGDLDWKPMGLEDCKSELEKVVRLLKTIRNNLFHGGKHGAAEWDDADRTQVLLTDGKSILDQLAILGGLEADYARYY